MSLLVTAPFSLVGDSVDIFVIQQYSTWEYLIKPKTYWEKQLFFYHVKFLSF